MRAALGFFVAFAGGVALAAACGATATPFKDGSQFDASVLTDAGMPGPAEDVVAIGDGSGCAPMCSSDLHEVLDCHGVRQRTCPDDQGCADGACVPACDSAKANRSTIGCDYYALQPDGSDPLQSGFAGGCYAIFVSNTWNAEVTLGLERDGTAYDIAQLARIPSGSGQALTLRPLPNGKLPPGQVAILFVSNTPDGSIGACPANLGGAAPPHRGPDVVGTGTGHAYHLTASAPVVAYDIYPYGGGGSTITSATLLLPTSAWDTNYVAISPYVMRQAADAPPASIQVVAAEDGTEITISPTAAIAGGGGVAPTGAGQPKKYTLARGQVLQFAQAAELSGSPIQSNKPVGMWSTSSCFNVEIAQDYCDSAHQQIPPVRALGSEYVAVRYRSRVDGQDEAVPWRIMGLVDGTELTYEPAQPPGAPSVLNAGQVVKFRAPGPFVVRSKDERHPIYVASYMTGCSTVGALNQGVLGCPGDADFVNVVPGKQFLTSYVFFTDPTYPETNLVIVRAKGLDGAFKDVSLDCAGVLGGWAPAGTSGDYEYTRFDLVRHNFAKQGSCDNGRHEIHSAAPFGVTVWGWGNNETDKLYTQAVSYGYPAGESVRAINPVVVAPDPR